MTPELRERIEAILAAPKRATDIEIDRAVTCTMLVHDVLSDAAVLRGEQDTYFVGKYCTDPRRWWPLVRELLGNGICITDQLCGLSVSHEATAKVLPLDVKKNEDGRAVCLAYLKMKLEKEEIE